MKRGAVRGFSLIEILVAAALIAVLGLAMFQLLRGSIRTSETVTTISSRYHLGRQAMERIARELSMAYLSAQRNVSNPVVQTDFKGQEEKIMFSALGHVPFNKNARESDQREISYYVESQDGKPALMRKAHTNLTLKLGEEGSADVVCSDVESLKFRYWDERIQDWRTTWSTEGVDAQSMLPARIEIELVVTIQGERKQKFLSQVELWMRKPIVISK